jgi:hypothetical protein
MQMLSKITIIAESEDPAVMALIIFESGANLWMKITHNRNPSPHAVVGFRNHDNVSKKELQEKLEICFTNQLGNINFGSVEFFLH